MSGLTHAGLFEGYGGTTMAAELALGPLDTRWCSDIKPASVALLAHRYPGVPNLGDMTEIDYAAAPRVDVLTASWPCQPHSSAGKRLGEADPRALWPHVARAVAHLRPALFLGENVARVAGNGELRRVVRALAELGYVGAWRCVRASDVGAPHRRDRCFVVAVDPAADAWGAIGWVAWHAESGDGSGTVGVRSTEPGRRDHGALTLLPTPSASSYGTNQGGAAGRVGPVRESLDTMARNGRFDERINDSGNHAQVGPGTALPGVRNPDGAEALQRSAGGPNSLPRPHDLLPGVREHARRGDRGGAALAGEEAPEGGVRGLRVDDGPARTPRGPEPGQQRPGQPDDLVRLVPPATALAGGSTEAHGSGATSAADCGCAPWGQYAAAVHRWEMVLGRVAPPPTRTHPRTGKPQLSARAVEWMMGLPDGHVCDVPGLSRAQQLSLLGDGVVPQQGAHAFRFLLGHLAERLAGERAA